MKTLIQRTDGEYWAGQNTWTPWATAAYVFSSSISALNAITVNKLSSVQLVFKFENPAYDIRIALEGGGSLVGGVQVKRR